MNHLIEEWRNMGWGPGQYTVLNSTQVCMALTLEHRLRYGTYAALAAKVVRMDVCSMYAVR